MINYCRDKCPIRVNFKELITILMSEMSSNDSDAVGTADFSVTVALFPVFERHLTRRGCTV